MYTSPVSHLKLGSFAVPAALVALCFALIAPAAGASGISQGYLLQGSAPAGSLVSLVSSRSGTVEPATTDNTDNLLGVVVATDSSLISASAPTSQAQVAVSGTVPALVSTINGEIKSGDRITASPLAGVGMRASESGKIVGVAQSGFSRSSAGATTTKVKDKHGSSRSVAVGTIPVLVAATFYAIGPGSNRTIIPVSIQNLANQIAGRDVGVLAILLSFIIIFVALLSITALVYGAIRGSIVSIGRNPLSRGTVYRSLLQVTVLILGILVAGMGSVYLILRGA